ncbi:MULTISPECIES: hypothetical protein [Streptomyces]|uniref:hypothetical protein n=1 Tax=Streptomyces TaxID=1883 RepID=UPI000AA30F45|nr:MULTISPECIES: hypothetical protein [Streptomyces]
MSGMPRKRVTGSAVCCAAAVLALSSCSSDDGGKDKASGTSSAESTTGTGGDGGGGNGVEDMSAQQISDRAKRELLDAKSVHISMRETGSDASADATEDSDPDADDPASMDLTLDQDGNCTGSMKMADGASLELVKRGDKVWMKPDETFWKTQVPGGDGEAAAEIFKNRYIHGSTKDAMLKEVAGVCDLGEIQRGIEDDSDDAKTLKKGEPTTVDGTRVVPLTGTEDGRETTLYVAAEGRPYLVKAVEKGDGDHTTTTFSDYDKPVPTKTPSADESVDVSKLQEQLQKV